MATVRRIDDKRQTACDPLRALAHDAAATFMLLDASFQRLAKEIADASEPFANVAHLDQVDHVSACIEQLGRHLAALGDLARSRVTPVKPRAVAAQRVIEEVLFEQRDLLATRNIEVVVEPSLPVFWCDDAHLRQIITNLVRNAALHGCDLRSPQIVISGKAHSQTAAGEQLAALWVFDNGPGIPTDRVAEAFLPGRRFNESVPGSGLGLAIVKQRAEEAGGSVFIDPACRSGLRMVVLLPGAPSPTHRKTARAANIHGGHEKVPGDKHAGRCPEPRAARSHRCK